MSQVPTSSPLLFHMQDTVWAMEAKRLAVAAQIAFRHSIGVQIPRNEIVAVTKVKGQDLRREARGEKLGFARRGTVAVIPVGGVISKYASMVDEISEGSGTNVQAVRQAIANAKRTEGIHSALLFIDSPGGTVAGIETLAGEIFAADETEGFPIEAYADDLACSAAYYIGCQARRFSGTEAVVAGSLACYSLIWDTSKFYQDQGVTVHLVASGPLKGAGADGPPVTDEHLSAIQAEIAKHHEIFGRAISRGRPNLADKLGEIMTGQVWIGGETVAVGLLDALEPVDAVLDRMNREYGSRNGGVSASKPTNGGFSMAARQTKDGAPAAMGGNQDTNAAGGGGGSSPADILAAVGGAGQGQGGAAPAGGQGGNGGAAPAANGQGQGQGGAAPAVLTFTPEQLQTAVANAVGQVTAENNRQANAKRAKIQAVTSAFGHIAAVQTLATAALADPLACNLEELQTKVLEAVAASAGPTGHLSISVGLSGRERQREGIEALLLTRARPSVLGFLGKGGDEASRMAKALGYATPAAFAKVVGEAQEAGLARRLRLIDVAEWCASEALARGGVTPSFRTTDEVLAASIGHSSSDFPHILSNLANKSLLAAMMEGTPKFDRFCSVGNLADFKTKSIISLSEAPELLLTPEGDTPENADFNERAESYKLSTYTRGFGITRQMVYNDDLDAFTRIPILFGRAALRVPDIIAFSIITTNPFCADGVRLFDAAHRNLAAAGTALSMTSLQKAFEAMETQKGFGEDTAWLEIEGKVVVVPSNLKFKAQKLRDAEFDPDAAGGGITNEPNVLRGQFEVVSSPRLKAASTTAHYLFADPSVVPAIEIGFLNGQRTPTIVPVGNGSILEKRWEVVFDCGGQVVSPEGAYKDPGA